MNIHGFQEMLGFRHCFPHHGAQHIDEVAYNSWGSRDKVGASAMKAVSEKFFFFFLLRSWHMEIPRPGMEPTPLQ